MLLGKRQRPPMKRTTSMSEIIFDLNMSGESETSNHQNDPHRKPPGTYGHNGQVVPTVDQRPGHHGLLDQRLLATVSPRGIERRHSADYSAAGYFLRSCSLCNRLLVPGRDIYMYRGDSAFCSLECRQKQMAQDERREKNGLTSKEKTVAATATDPAAEPAGSAKGGRVAAAV